jgi:uncharacterized membrane protein
MDAEEHRAPTLFEAVVVPHRSLSARGLRILIGAIVALTALVVVRFWLIGAWPIAPFAVLEVGLAAFLLRLNARRARESELILLTETDLTIIRTDIRGGRQTQRLSPDWLNVVLRDRPGRTPALLLAARGEETEIGTSLGEAEKRSLAEALRGALDRRRHPRFDNVQLRPERRSESPDEPTARRAPST